MQPSLLQDSLALVLSCLMVVGMNVGWGFEFSLLIFTSACKMIHFLNAGRHGPTLCLFLCNLFPKTGDKLQLFRYLSCVLPGRGEVMAPFPAQWHLAPGSLGSLLDMGCLVSNLLLSALWPEQKMRGWQFSADSGHGSCSIHGGKQEKIETWLSLVAWDTGGFWPFWS